MSRYKIEESFDWWSRRWGYCVFLVDCYGNAMTEGSWWETKKQALAIKKELEENDIKYGDHQDG